MKLGIYSLRDSLLGVYLAPFQARADIEAKRTLANTMKDPQMANQAIVTNSHDYQLCKLAVFDDESGAIFSANGPETICSLSDLKAANGAPVPQPRAA